VRQQLRSFGELAEVREAKPRAMPKRAFLRPIIKNRRYSAETAFAKKK